MLNRIGLSLTRKGFRCSKSYPRQPLRNLGTMDKTPVNVKGPVTYRSLGVFVVVFAGLIAYYQIEKERQLEKVSGTTVKTVGKPSLGGSWVLVDQDGVPRTNASYFGQYSILYFGFTHCPDICPSELVKLGKILNSLESKGITVKPIFISVDPARDCLVQLRHYAQDFHKSFSYLTGTKEQVAAATKGYRVYFSKANEDENDEEEYLVDHSIVLYFLSPEGEFLDFFTQKMQIADVVQRITDKVNADKKAATEAKGK